jgi:hypothetical protein
MRACRVVRQAPVRAVLGACRWRRGQALVRGRGRQNGTPRPRATAWLASACMGAVAGTCGAGVGAPRTTGTGRDATRAGVPLRRSWRRSWRPWPGWRNVADGIRVVCLSAQRIPGGTWAEIPGGEMDEIYGPGRGRFC